MSTTPQQNKDVVLKAFDALFNKRDFTSAEQYWSAEYVQHSAHIGPGRRGLFDLVQSLPGTLRYENQTVVAEGDYVMLYGRFSGNGSPRSLITTDVVRMQDGKLAEHWDVWQDEVTRGESSSGLPMFGDLFPHEPQP
ncbi:nuclear transport factor 2 family protein [Streptomyces sp. NBC_00564]|uniref:nuclear transport factor 2 family protein n=1 Tax=Streptomyces sp. NBC_00564 TaxID=2903663 RepID=UPI00352FD223|nr:ester cyclase [Streptomyces sp. NBC_00564]